METKKKRGPQSERGRAVSSMNALRIGVYSNSLLPGESQQEVDEMVEQLMQGWPGEGAEQQISARLYVQSALKSARLHAAEVALTEARMHSSDVRLDFCHKAGLPSESSRELPDWYFDSDPAPKQEAMRLGRVLAQAEQLLGSSMMVYGSGVRDLLPDLWAQEMGPGTLVSKLTLVEKLGKRYPLGKPEAIVQAFIDEQRERFACELLWAKYHRRFEAVLAGIRARIVIEVGTRDDWQKADSLLHRRRLELSQHVHTLARQRAQLEPVPALEAVGVSLRLPQSPAGRARARPLGGDAVAADQDPAQDVEQKAAQGT
jgi:hypothetical protein